MSTQHTSNSNESKSADKILTRIEDFLINSIDGNQAYYKSNRIANATGMKPKQVGAVIKELNNKSTKFNVEKWGRSKSTTWLVKKEQ